MKGRLSIILPILIIWSIFLSGCSIGIESGDKNIAKEHQETEKERENQDSEENGKNVDIEYLDWFAVATQEQMKEIPDTEGLANTATKALEVIGVSGNTDITWGNYRNENNSIVLEAYGTTAQSKSILISFQYSSTITSPKWNIEYVKDVSTGNYYYVSDELKNTVDLYDYSTGKLISEN